MSEVTGIASVGQVESESAAADPESSGGGSGSQEGQAEAVRPHANRSSTAELGGMILAFAFGAAGFAIRILWIPALVAMAVVFGLLMADRRTSRSTKGVVPEIVASVVKEAREIYQAASGASDEEDANKATGKTDDPNDASPDADSPGSEAFDPSSGEAVSTNGHSFPRELDPSRDHVGTSGNPVRSHGEPDDGDEGETESGPSVGTGAVTRPAVRLESDETKSAEAEAAAADPDSSSSEEPPDPANEPAERSANPLPIRFILSADHIAAHNSLLRPVRKHVLSVATSLSQTIVKLAATSHDDSDR